MSKKDTFDISARVILKEIAPHVRTRKSVQKKIKDAELARQKAYRKANERYEAKIEKIKKSQQEANDGIVSHLKALKSLENLVQQKDPERCLIPEEYQDLLSLLKRATKPPPSPNSFSSRGRSKAPIDLEIIKASVEAQGIDALTLGQTVYWIMSRGQTSWTFSDVCNRFSQVRKTFTSKNTIRTTIHKLEKEKKLIKANSSPVRWSTDRRYLRVQEIAENQQKEQAAANKAAAEKSLNNFIRNKLEKS